MAPPTKRVQNWTSHLCCSHWQPPWHGLCLPKVAAMTSPSHRLFRSQTHGEQEPRGKRRYLTFEARSRRPCSSCWFCWNSPAPSSILSENPWVMLQETQRASTARRACTLATGSGSARLLSEAIQHVRRQRFSPPSHFSTKSLLWHIETYANRDIDTNSSSLEMTLALPSSICLRKLKAAKNIYHLFQHL